jgi:two-component system response regulator HydG
MAQFDQLVVDDLPERVRAYRPEHGSDLMPTAASDLVTVAELEQRYIRHVLGVERGNKSRAARILGYDRRTLYRKLEREAATAQSSENANAPKGNGADVSKPDSDRDSSDARASSTPPSSVIEDGANGSADGATERTILVVDDDRDTLEILQILLESKGFRVQTAAGIAEAMRARDVDIVLTDVRLGDGIGSDLVGRFGSAPVVAMSGHSRDGFDEVGFREWLTKPVSLERLTTALETVLAAP